jgi:hypothetical protein
MTWTLTICLGVLWGGMCEQVHQFIYPSEAACVFEMKRVNARSMNGYAKCTPTGTQIEENTE